MPGTMRSASTSVVAPISCMVFSVTTDTDFGVSSSSAVNFGEEGANQLPRTCTLSRSVACVPPASASAACAAKGVKPAARVAVASRVVRGAYLRDVMWFMDGRVKKGKIPCRLGSRNATGRLRAVMHAQG